MVLIWVANFSWNSSIEPLDTVNYGFLVQKPPFFLYSFFQVEEQEKLLTFQIDRVIIELILDSTLNGWQNSSLIMTLPPFVLPVLPSLD